MPVRPASPPYFEKLVERLAAGDPDITAAFGKHVHWGFWNNPPQHVASAQQYGEAAEQLCLRVVEKADVCDGLRILDVGCGFGGTLHCLNDRFAQLSLVGVNIDRRQLQRASLRVAATGSNSIKWLEADAMCLPFDLETFDRVLAVECAFHFDRHRFLAEASRVLTRGGILAISDFLPTQQAADYLADIGPPLDEAIRWTYGEIDFTWPLARYIAAAEDYGLALIESVDVTTNTLPTYDYLDQSVQEWMTSDELSKFQLATGLLAKASRRGLVGYQILAFMRL